MTWSEESRHPWWKPSVNDYKIECRVEGIRAVHRVPHYDVRRTDNGDTRKLTLPNHTTLTNALIEAQAVNGDRLRIEWVGWKLTGKYRRSTLFYAVVVEGKRDNGLSLPKDLLPRETWAPKSEGDGGGG